MITPYKQMIQWFYRKLAKSRLIRRYLYLIEVDRLMEEYLTKRILDGGSQEFIQKSRTSLVNLQNDSAENLRLVNFLRTK